MVILGLGSNQGGRQQHLENAATHLRELLESVHYSPVYESPALLPEGAPEEWNIPFLNMAVAGETSLAPQALLEAVKSIEQKLGRVARGHWGPREIDIDILAYGGEVITAPHLVIPHPELLNRDFALIPLASLAPDWIHPVAGKTARELAAGMQSNLTATDIRIS